MALTPDDIVNHEFRQTMRGYAVAEVDDLLDRLADQVERNERDLAELRQRLEADAGKLAEAQRNEAALTQTLVTAQQTAQRIVQDAEERAAIVVSDAEAQAEELRAEAAREAASTTAEATDAAERMRAETEQERTALRERLEHLAAVERAHRADLRAHLERQLAALDDRDDGPAAEALGADDQVRHGLDADAPGDGGALAAAMADVDDEGIAERGWGDLLDATRDQEPAHEGAAADDGHGDVHADHADDGHDGQADDEQAEQHHAHGG